MTNQQGAQALAQKPVGGFVRLLLVFSILGNIALSIVVGALLDPLDLNEPTFVSPPAVTAPSATPSASRAPYQFSPVSKDPVPSSQQCPDAGSVAAGAGDNKTEVLEIKGQRGKPAVLLGPNRRVVIAEKAVMTGAITVCGDGGTILIIGTQKGPVLMRGNGVKIVVQDGDAAKLPPAYSMSNGQALRCTTGKADPATPNCENYRPRPGAKPNG